MQFTAMPVIFVRNAWNALTVRMGNHLRPLVLKFAKGKVVTGFPEMTNKKTENLSGSI